MKTKRRRSWTADRPFGLPALKKRLVVAIPVKDEEEQIGGCIRSLLTQTVAVDDIVLLLNNCTDQSRAAAETAAGGFGGLHLVERRLHGSEATAGGARRHALVEALGIAGDGIILTTDAGVTWTSKDGQKWKRQ